MNSQHLLTINKHIEVFLKNTAGYYSSRIEDIDDNFITIAMPRSNGTPVFTQYGQDISLQFVTDDQFYQGSCKVISSQMIPLPVWKLTRPQDIERVQRRLLVRIQTILPLTITLPEPLANLPAKIPSKTKDLSAGGIQFITKYKLTVGEEVNVDLFFPDNSVVNAAAQILRVKDFANGQSSKLFAVAVKFLDVDEHKGRKIIQFIFETERRRLR